MVLIENIEADGVRSIHTGNVITSVSVTVECAGKKPIMKNITIMNVHAEIPMDKPMPDIIMKDRSKISPQYLTRQHC